MNKSRVCLNVANDLLRKAKVERDKVKEEGRNEEWNRKKYAEIEGKYQADVTALTNKMMEMARAETEEAKRQYKNLRNKPHSPLRPKDSNAQLYHQNKMQMALQGLSEEEAINEYPNILDGLTDQEMAYRYVYEDGLMAKMKDLAYKHVAEQTIFKHKPIEEKMALVNAQKAEALQGQLESLVPIIKDDVIRVASGKINPPDYDYQVVVDEVGTQNKNSSKQVSINPYDEGNKENPDL